MHQTEPLFTMEGALIKVSYTAAATLVAVAAATAMPAWPADAVRGEARSAQCVACHGRAGVSTNPLFPHLAGQQAGYLQRQLEAFRDGDRYDPLMTPVAQSLSLDDIDDLAAHYSRLGPLADADRPEQGRTARPN